MSRGYGAPGALRTGEFIRWYLLNNEEVNPYDAYTALRAEKKGRGLKVPSPRNMYFYFWILEKLKLIEKIRQGERADSPLKMRKVIYKIVPGKEGSDDWSDPQGAYKERLGK